MSKKNTSKAKAEKEVVKNKSSENSLISSLFNNESKAPDHSLIYFDIRVKILLALLLGLYLILSFAKLHTSSVGIWEQTAGVKSPKAIIAGTAKGIRQDEWMVGTPSLIGQYNKGFPVTDPTMGSGNVPVILGMPIKDITMILRPNLWAYFFMDVERAFAFHWNFSIFIFLISTFLLFLLLTRNKFWLSLFGALFIFSSSAIQWWSYNLGKDMIFLNGIAIAFIYILYAKDILSFIVSAVVLLMCSYNVISGIYPPFEIPLLYLYTLLILGFILKRKSFQSIKEKLLIRIGTLALVGIALVVFGLHYYNLAKDTFDILLNTAYPGRRSTNGGDLIAGKLFSGFFDMYMTDAKYPSQWLNICEASSFIMFFPIIFYAIGYDLLKTKKTDWLVLSVAFYVLFMLAWVMLGFPEFLSKITMMNVSPAYRTLPVLGVGNCFLLICFLGNSDVSKSAVFSWIEFTILSVGTFIFTYMVGNHINDVTNSFFKSDQVMTATFLFTLVYLLIRYNTIKFTSLGLGLILLGINFSNFKIHPLTSGLSSLLENPLVKMTKELHEKDPQARWAVFGNQMLSNLLKVNGINVFNGVKNTPLLNDMKLLDSTGKDNFIYNRFAHINMGSYINYTDTVIFKLNENEVVNDNYSIYMDPCSPRLEKLGIKYYMFSYQPKPAEVRCMTPLVTSGIYIYKRE